MSVPARPSGQAPSRPRPAIATFLIWFATGFLLLWGAAAFLFWGFNSGDLLFDMIAFICG